MTERNYPPIFVENGYFHQKNKEKKFNKKKKFQQREEILGTRYNHKTWLPWKKKYRQRDPEGHPFECSLSIEDTK